MLWPYCTEFRIAISRESATSPTVKGGYQGARKATAMDGELTEEERDFLANMVRLMIRKRGEAAAKDSVEGDPDAE